MTLFFWSHLSPLRLDELRQQDALFFIPLGACENHGSHLPLGTDTLIMDGLLARASLLSFDQDVVVLPSQAITLSPEHSGFSGTLSFSSQHFLAHLQQILSQLGQQGWRRGIMLSSHGGNMSAMDLAAREARIAHDMIVFQTNWRRFIDAQDLGVDEATFQRDIHGGLYETALMLELYPELVDLDAADSFSNAQDVIVQKTPQLSAYGKRGYNWMMRDLNPNGVCGDASSATRELGEHLVEITLARFQNFIAEVGQFELPHAP